MLILEGVLFVLLFFFFKQKTAYEMCGRDWSSDVCSSDLREGEGGRERGREFRHENKNYLQVQEIQTHQNYIIT